MRNDTRKRLEGSEIPPCDLEQRDLPQLSTAGSSSGCELGPSRDRSSSNGAAPAAAAADTQSAGQGAGKPDAAADPAAAGLSCDHSVSTLHLEAAATPDAAAAAATVALNPTLACGSAQASPRPAAAAVLHKSLRGSSSATAPSGWAAAAAASPLHSDASWSVGGANVPPLTKKPLPIPEPAAAAAAAYSIETAANVTAAPAAAMFPPQSSADPDADAVQQRRAATWAAALRGLDSGGAGWGGRGHASHRRFPPAAADSLIIGVREKSKLPRGH